MLPTFNNTSPTLQVHVMCGVSSSTLALGLNVPALWAPSYTATPTAEESRAGFVTGSMRKVVARRKRSAGAAEQEEEVEEQSQRQARMAAGLEGMARQVRAMLLPVMAGMPCVVF